MWTPEPETLLGGSSSSSDVSYLRGGTPGQQSVGSGKEHRIIADYSVNYLFLGITKSRMKVTGHA